MVQNSQTTTGGAGMIKIDNRIKTRRFAVYPLVKDVQEDLALQQIQLREEFCLFEFSTDIIQVKAVKEGERKNA